MKGGGGDRWLSPEGRRDVITNKGSSHSLITELCDFFLICIIVYFYNAHTLPTKLKAS